MGVMGDVSYDSRDFERLLLFSVEFKGSSNTLLRLGRMSMMIAFGAGFGNTVTFRVNTFIERIMFLLLEWLKL